MKRPVEHPAPSERELSGPRYWRSLDELVATPWFREYLERAGVAGFVPAMAVAWSIC